MTPKERAAMQQALEALVVAEEFVDRHSEDWYISGQQDLKQIRESITALREALAEQSEQEPIGVVEANEEWGIAGVLVAGVPIGTKLYAAPVRTKDLTDDEIKKIGYDNEKYSLEGSEWFDRWSFARAVIAADREKNK